MTKKQKKVLNRIIVSGILLAFLICAERFVPAAGSAFSQKNWAKFLAYIVPYIIIGYEILKKARKGILNRQVFDENFLMAVATIGALFLGEYQEACAVMLFYQVGELFQNIAVGKSRKNIAALMDIRPDFANVEDGDGKLVQVSPEEVAVGTVIVVQAGEKIPIDGVVVEGKATLDTAALTGESVPREVEKDDEVLSGCINMSGVLKIRTTKAAGESTASKILDLVENASSKKSKTENFITKFAKVYTPAVCYGALALALLPPVVNVILGNPTEIGRWCYRALTFLVISCPCALVISIPLTFFAGIGKASREGILVKGSNYLEVLSKIRTVVFDKTGTMTKGVFEVSGIHHNSMEEKELLKYAAHAEFYSKHPIALSLQKAYISQGGEIDPSKISDVSEIGGNGITAKVEGRHVALGNSKLMDRLGVEYKECHHAGTIIHAAIDGQYVGHILISDILKPSAVLAVSNLKKAGVSKTVMLTGDNKSVAEKVGEELGISEVYSELLPQDKVLKVEELLNASNGGKLAFVGDGINDAPVLSRADIGISMGALGSDAAIEASDVVLMDDDPLKISKAISLSRKAILIVYQNIYFSIGVKFLCLILGALGIANMWYAIFADVGVMVLAVLNALRMFGKR